MVMDNGSYKNSLNSGSSASLTPLEQEKSGVKRSLKAKLTDKTVWHVISMTWFAKWKLYVNFDDTFPEPRDPQVTYSRSYGAFPVFYYSFVGN
jgi:hypothetical protein